MRNPVTNELAYVAEPSKGVVADVNQTTTTGRAIEERR
jgi:hypothetical protein